MLIPRPENGASHRHPSPPPVVRPRGAGLVPVPATPESRIRSSPSPPTDPGPECEEAVELLRRLLVLFRGQTTEDRRRILCRPSSVLRRRFSYDTCMRLLIVEDDRDAADYLVKAFREIGHVADRAADGEEGLALGLEGQYDVLVVDRMLPKLDGLAVIGQLRAEGVETPVLILSALGQVDDRVKGLRAGGDDYLPKPYSFAELAARVEVLARRRGGRNEETVYRVGDLELDRLSHRVSRGDDEIVLQPREFRLLEYLMKHAGQVVTRTMLLENVWDYHFDPQTNVIDVHMARLGLLPHPPLPRRRARRQRRLAHARRARPHRLSRDRLSPARRDAGAECR